MTPVPEGIRLWGLNAPAYLPPLVTLAIWTAAALGLLLVFRSRDPLTSIRIPSWVPAAVGLLAFLILRSRYSLLGDNMLRVQDALNLTANPYERGIISLHNAILSLAGAETLQAGRKVFVWMSLAAGAVYVAAAWVLGRTLSRHPFWITLGLVGSGITALFCGYVEVYPWVLIWIILSVLASLFAARGAIPTFVPVLMAAPGVLLHSVFVLWLPALAVPLVTRLNRGQVPLRTRWIIGGGTLLGLVTGMILGGRLPVLIPVHSAVTSYTLFSAAHISDYLNAQILGSLAGFLLALPALALWWRRPGLPSSASVVLILAWLPPATALFVFRPLLGGADWDVLALASPFAFLFAFTEMTGLPLSGNRSGQARGSGSRHRHRVIASALILSAAHTISWLSLLAGEWSTEWFRDLIRSDRADYFTDRPAEIHLGFVFQSNDLPRLAEKEFLAGVSRYPDDPRFAMNLAALASGRGDWDSVSHWAERAWETLPGYPAPLYLLYLAYGERGLHREQLRVGERILDAHSHVPDEIEQFIPRQRMEEIREELHRIEQQLRLDDSSGIP